MMKNNEVNNEKNYLCDLSRMYSYYYPEKYFLRWNNCLKLLDGMNNYDCAISLRFDDNLVSHVEYVIPLLNKYGFKGTFMINPGRNYKKYQDFWENKLPQMGHRWGNHTWHHEGAKNLEEAEFEIGEVSKLIWKLYPNESKFNVFASGGGEEWGGKRWSEALPAYKEIVKKYYLIDLYDGNHPALGLNSDYSFERDQI